MCVNFQRSYYGREPQQLMNKEEFIKEVPLVVIDCSHQNESIKNAPVDVRLEIQATKPFPASTVAYCLIIHDRIVQYNPLSGEVKKLV